MAKFQVLQGSHAPLGQRAFTKGQSFDCSEEEAIELRKEPERYREILPRAKPVFVEPVVEEEAAPAEDE